MKKMHSATIFLKKYFSKQTLLGIFSNIAAKKLILRYSELRLNFSFKMIFEPLAYNGVLGIPYKLDPIVRLPKS